MIVMIIIITMIITITIIIIIPTPPATPSQCSLPRQRTLLTVHLRGRAAPQL